MFETRGLSNSHVGVMRFELFSQLGIRKVFEDVTAFLSQGRACRYPSTFPRWFYFVQEWRNVVLYSYSLRKGKTNKMAGVKGKQ